MAKVPLNSSERLYRDVLLHPSLDPVMVCGSFETTAGADVVNVLGEGFEVEWAATGQFTVTLAVKYPGAMCIVATHENATAAAVDVNCNVAPYVFATKSFDIFLTSAGAAGDNAGDRVNFMAVFHLKDSLNVSRS